MPCYHPLRAWRTPTGEVLLTKEEADCITLALPCGGCLGCRMAHAKQWALRCQLELQQHGSAVFTTLTYNEQTLPPTLDKRHLQLWLKRLRKDADRPIRFFASGEYGEKNNRPHYHAILYGLSMADERIIDAKWAMGYTKTANITPAAIAYTAGYTSKKIGYRKRAVVEQVDPNTGEVYTWQPPFLQMSRKPGIGGHARQYTDSWRLYAIQNGTQMPVPRFLHEAWKKQATPEQIEQLQYERQQRALTRYTTQQQLQAAEQIAIAKQAIQADRRKL